MVPKFNKEIHQNAAVWEGVDELTLRESGEGTLHSCMKHCQSGSQQMEAAARGRGPERNVSSHLHGLRGGVGGPCPASLWR